MLDVSDPLEVQEGAEWLDVASCPEPERTGRPECSLQGTGGLLSLHSSRDETWNPVRALVLVAPEGVATSVLRPEQHLLQGF